MTYTGRLLVATPSLTHPNFDRSVVLVIGHSEEGALGVVLNRVSEVPVASVLPEWSSTVCAPPTLFEGGPVQPDAAVCLARVRAGQQPEGWAQVSGRLGTVDFSAGPDVVLPYVECMRVFAGYAGWGDGQLEMEIGVGAWFVLDLLPGDAFTQSPEDLWQAVLRRQGGLMAAVATYPTDPSLN
jgi:putative transcriptional regulator